MKMEMETETETLQCMMNERTNSYWVINRALGSNSQAKTTKLLLRDLVHLLTHFRR